jgi:hypothetical protein
MSTQMTNAFLFRWRSWFGLGVVLFLLYGALNFLAAVFVPLSLHTNGPGAVGGALVLSPTADPRAPLFVSSDTGGNQRELFQRHGPGPRKETAAVRDVLSPAPTLDCAV